MDSFTALADPTRRKIIELLGSGERTAGAIGEQFPISAPAVSQHLKTLRTSGLIRVRIDGQRRIYSLDPRGLTDMEEWIGRMREYWRCRLENLERELSLGGKDD